MKKKRPLTTPAAIRVLVIDDEASIRQLIATVLTSSGWEVETAADGREGLQMLLQHDFDVMVVDIKMQGMDGITFLQEALKIWPWLGVVVVSGYADQHAVEEASALGVTRILNKPLELDSLRQNVMEEAEAKRKRVLLSSGSSLDRIRAQLGILRQLTDTAIASERLVDALHSLSSGLGRSMDCAVAGVLVLEEDESLLLLSAQAEVTPEFLEQTRDEIRRRYEVLSGRTLDSSSLRVETDGIPPSAEGAAEAGSMFSVPIIAGGEFHGLLALVPTKDETYDTADVSFLYHAANHLSTVFAALSRMRHLAVRDSLTGLYNRRHLEEELERTWLLSQRYDHSMCIVIIDIDQFKHINDTYGHPVADHALREFSALIQEVARASDIIARYGGDEFVVVLPQAERDEARKFCERLMKRIREYSFCSEMKPIRITLSIGVADNRSASQPHSKDELLAQADRALYAAKNSGRNQVCVWADVLDRAGDGPELVVQNAFSASAEIEQEDSGRGILVVDDDEVVRRVLDRLLSEEDYDVTTAGSVLEAAGILSERRGEFAIVITDLQMPESSGVELLKQLSGMDESLVKIVISGHATVGNAIESLRYGAYDFVEKPLRGEQMLAVVRRALEYHRLVRENARYKDYLEDVIERKSAALASALEEVKHSYSFTLEALVAMLDARESDTGEHSLRVREATMVLARKLEVRGKPLEDLATGALLHDIGKIAIPDAVLLKKGPLTDQEVEIMRTHPDIGYNILRSSPLLIEAAEIVLSHQEHYDGSGYPRGLSGDDICMGARIFSVVDAYDAMRSNRVYRPSLGIDEALNEIRRARGSQFDPNVVDAFFECHEEIEKVIGWPEPEIVSPNASSAA